MKAYNALLAESKRLNCPRMWPEDLTRIDRAYLEDKRPAAFVWILRETGTHLIDLAAMPKKDAKQCLTSAQRWYENVVAIYVYDCHGLRHVTPYEAETFISAHYE